MPEWFVYCRDQPGTDELRMQLLEEHAPRPVRRVEIHRWRFGGRPAD